MRVQNLNKAFVSLRNGHHSDTEDNKKIIGGI